MLMAMNVAQHLMTSLNRHTQHPELGLTSRVPEGKYSPKFRNTMSGKYSEANM